MALAMLKKITRRIKHARIFLNECEHYLISMSLFRSLLSALYLINQKKKKRKTRTDFQKATNLHTNFQMISFQR